MRFGLAKALLAGLILIISALPSAAHELKTYYAVIVYEKEDHLRQFDRRISLGSLSYLLRNKKNITTFDEIRNKLDVLVERVETILDMFPVNLQFKIVLLSTDADVQRTYKEKYGRSVDYIAFYSPREKTIYISVDDVRTGVLAHELTHVILDHYFGVPPPVKIHEVLAQFVETHLND